VNSAINRIICLLLLPLLFMVTACLARPAHVENTVNLTVEERDWLEAHPDKLTVYFNVEFPPIEFISETGAFIGMGADVLARVEELLGVTFIRIPSDEWNEHLAALYSGECAVAPTIVKTPEREEFVYFTRPYATVPVVLITTRDAVGGMSLDDFSGRRIGVVSGYATEKYLLDQALIAGFEVVPVANVAEGLQGASFGRIDAFAENLAVAAYYIDKLGIPNLRVAGSTGYVFAWSIGVSREYPLLYSAIQKALNAIPQSELDGIRKQWIALEAGSGLDQAILRGIKVVALFVGLLLVSLAGITIVLKRRLNQKILGLRESEERFRLSMEAVNDGVWDWDIQSGHVYYSPGYVRMLGYETTDVPAHVESWIELIHSEDKESAFRGNMDCIENRTESFAVEFRMQARDGSWKWILGRGRAVGRDASGKAMRLIGTHQDITERKQAEQEREKLQSQLHQAQKMESVGILAGGVAHDFNNLLHVIRGNIELLARNLSRDPQSENRLESVSRALDRAARLVQQLLFFSRKAEPGKEWVDLNQEVREAVRMLERTIPKMVALELHLDPDIWPISGDPVQIEQVLLNLANNSVDAMPDGGRLVIETGNVELDADFVRLHPGASTGPHVFLTVSDTGCGMDAMTRKHVFDPFFTTKEVGQGTGLGLASVYGIITAYGGYIQCYSEPGQGTTFRIYLPALEGGETGAEASQNVANVPNPQRAEDQDNQTILVVDDEREIRELTQEALEDFGYVVLSAANGEEALDIYQEHGQTIDLILLDLNMPGMGGHKCLQELQRLNPTVRVLISSGYSANVQAAESLKSGAVGFIGKPYQLKELEAAVREALGKAEE
jgi:PAS domain S-box-containing protein